MVTAFLGAFVQQTTVVVAAAPALQRWAPQAGFTPREILLPIASIGGMSQNFMIDLWVDVWNIPSLGDCHSKFLPVRKWSSAEPRSPQLLP